MPGRSGSSSTTTSEVRPLSASRSAPRQQLHDDLVAVGADYFYPFAFGTMIALAMAWVGSLLFIQADVGGLRRSLAVVGLFVLAVQLVALSAALETYVLITD